MNLNKQCRCKKSTAVLVPVVIQAMVRSDTKEIVSTKCEVFEVTCTACGTGMSPNAVLSEKQLNEFIDIARQGVSNES